MSGSIPNSAGRVAFQLSYQISPIILTGGIAALMPGGLLPIVTILDAGSTLFGLINSATTSQEFSLDDSFAHFSPLPGSSLLEVELGKYPFANQAVAANAIIKQPLHLSMIMKSPVRGPGGYTNKLITMSALQAIINQHSDLGGTYTIATPAFIFQSGILLRVFDAGSDGKQPQVNWQWDFEFPLITLAQAAAAMSTTMGKMSQGLQTDGSTSGVAATIGNPATGGASSLVPGASGVTGATVSTAPIVPVQQVPLPPPGGQPAIDNAVIST